MAKVLLYSPQISVLQLSSVLEFSSLVILLEEFVALSVAYAIYSSRIGVIFVPPDTTYCWMGRGCKEREVSLVDFILQWLSFTTTKTVIVDCIVGINSFRINMTNTSAHDR